VFGIAVAAARAEIHVSLSATPRDPFVRQDVTLTLAVRFSGTRLAQEMEVLGLPDRPGADLSAFREKAVRRRANGAVVTETREYEAVIRFLEPGRASLRPTVVLQELDRGALSATDEAATVRREYATAIDLDVRALPAGAPPHFSGAVGNYTLQVACVPDRAAAGDIVRVRCTLQGTGYRRALLAPRLAPAPGFRVYGPRRLPDDDAGAVVFEQLVVALLQPPPLLPAVEFPFFNPGSGRYETLSRGPFNLAAPRASSAQTAARKTLAACRLLLAERGSLPAAARRRGIEILRNHGGRDAVPARIAVLLAVRNREWKAAALAGLAASAVALLVGRLRRRGRRAARAIAFAGLLLACTAVPADTRRCRLRAHGAVVHGPSPLRLAPAESALALHELPDGALVSVQSTRGDWRLVATSTRRGWVRAGSLEALR
jgi:hypothetical protein